MENLLRRRRRNKANHKNNEKVSKKLWLRRKQEEEKNKSRVPKEVISLLSLGIQITCILIRVFIRLRNKTSCTVRTAGTMMMTVTRKMKGRRRL